MQVKASELLTFLLKDVLGAMNFDAIPKWEIEQGPIPKTFFSDRLKNNPQNPINKDVVERIIKLYQAQLGIYKMREPISEVISCEYANKVSEYIADITSINLDQLKNVTSHVHKNKERREQLIDILSIVLELAIGKDVFDASEVKDEIEKILEDSVAYMVVSPYEVAISENVKKLHLVQQSGKCPICNSRMIISAGDNVAENYHIVKINDTDSPTAENTIAICANCFINYQNGIQPGKNELMKLKAQMKLDNMYSDKIDTLNMDKEIEKVLDALQGVRESELKELNYKPVKVEKKIVDDFLLRDKIKGYVVRYFNFVGSKLKQLNAENKLKYAIISNDIKGAYLAFAEMQGLETSEIFDKMVEWLMQKTNCTNKVACEIVIAYYVQNCEVFDEIAE